MRVHSAKDIFLILEEYAKMNTEMDGKTKKRWIIAKIEWDFYNTSCLLLFLHN